MLGEANLTDDQRARLQQIRARVSFTPDRDFDGRKTVSYDAWEKMQNRLKAAREAIEDTAPHIRQARRLRDDAMPTSINDVFSDSGSKLSMDLEILISALTEIENLDRPAGKPTGADRQRGKVAALYAVWWRDVHGRSAVRDKHFHAFLEAETGFTIGDSTLARYLPA